MDHPVDLRVNERSLRIFCASTFERLGVATSDAVLWADAIIETSLRGVDSHGILVLPMYLEMLEAGGIKANAALEVIKDEGPTLLLDGGQGIGAVIAHRAMNLALDRAVEFGLSFVAVRNSNHFGSAGYYAAKSLERDMIGGSLTNAGPAVAAWGGKSKVIGSNAMAVAVPAESEFPIVLDLAIGASAAAKIFLAGERGERIPTDWMLDRNGQPTDDPSQLFAGGILQSFGKHKGAGLGLIVDVLTGVISGGLFSTAVRGFGPDRSVSQGVCHSFWGLDVRRFMDVGQFKRRVDEMIRNVKASETRDAFERVYLPGEKGFLTRQDRERNGIPLWTRLVKDLKELSKRLSVDSPFPAVD
ncbi:MAG: Ldh family oxidoreductase [Pyrinomonadaceae bacterium]